MRKYVSEDVDEPLLESEDSEQISQCGFTTEC